MTDDRRKALLQMVTLFPFASAIGGAAAAAAVEYQIPGGPYVNVLQDATQYALPGYGYINLT